jgi:predicted nucleic acid-binding protein
MGRLIPASLPVGTAVALDTVALIYFLERHPVHYGTARELFLRMEAGEIAGVMSTLVLCELLVPAYRVGDTERVRTLTRLLMNFPHLATVPLSPEISVNAGRLRAQHGLRTPDAIHAATALSRNANGIVTNDQHLSRVEGEIPVWLFEGAD